MIYRLVQIDMNHVLFKCTIYDAKSENFVSSFNVYQFDKMSSVFTVHKIRLLWIGQFAVFYVA